MLKSRTLSASKSEGLPIARPDLLVPGSAYLICDLEVVVIGVRSKNFLGEKTPRKQTVQQAFFSRKSYKYRFPFVPTILSLTHLNVTEMGD